MKRATPIKYLLILVLPCFTALAHAVLPDEPWVRSIMSYQDHRFRLINCGTTLGPRQFARPLPRTQYFCIARPVPFDGRSIFLHQDPRKNWLHFEIFNCQRSESAINGSAGYLTEACEIVELNHKSLKRAGAPVALNLRTEWNEQAGGLKFHFRHRGQVYSGMTINLHELHEQNR